jgi:hypothetical protein
MDLSSVFDRFPDLLNDTVVLNYPFSSCWTASNPGGAYEDKDVAAALMICGGNLSATSKLLKRSRRSLHGYVLRNTELSELLEDIELAFVDEVETLYRNDAKTGDPAARKFFLVTLGKNRGYVTRSENSGPNGGPIPVSGVLDPSKLKEASRDFLKDLLEANATA